MPWSLLRNPRVARLPKRLKADVVRKKMKTRYVVVALMLCATACLAGDSTSPTGLTGVVTATQTIVELNGTLVASVVISNAGPESVTIDTTPDEIIQPKTKRFGAVTRQRGSRFTITLYQDLNADNRIEGFRTGDRKIGFRSREAKIVMHPGDTYVENFPFILSHGWGSVALREGPARIKAMLHLVIDGERIDLPCRECHLVLKNGDRTTTKSTLSPEAAPSASPDER